MLFAADNLLHETAVCHLFSCSSGAKPDPSHRPVTSTSSGGLSAWPGSLPAGARSRCASWAFLRVARCGHVFGVIRALTAGDLGVNQVPGLAVAHDRDRAALVGAKEGDLVPAQE